VLKNRKTDQVLFVVNFALLPITNEAEVGVGEDETTATDDDELD
jgi:hypothetical protein